MNASLLCLLLAAAPPVAPTAAVAAEPADVPRLVDAGWSVGAAIGRGSLTADVERRLVGRVWLGGNLRAGTSSDDITQTTDQLGAPTSVTDAATSAWSVGGGLRFRLQLLPDDTFLRPSLFLGGSIAVDNFTREDVQTELGVSAVSLTSASTTVTTAGNFGVMLDFTLLPWLALRASSSLVQGGYRSTTSSVSFEQEDTAPSSSSTTGGGWYGGLQLEPAVGLQAFF